MTVIRRLAPPDTASWQASWRARLAYRYQRHGLLDSEITALLDDASAPYAGAAGALVAALMDRDSTVALVAASVRSGPYGRFGAIDDIWVDPAHRRAGHGRVLRDHVITWFRPTVTRVELAVDPDDAAAVALFSSFTVRSRAMRKELLPAVQLPDGITARPLHPSEFPGWLDNAVSGYASDLAQSGAIDAHEAVGLSARTYQDLLPHGIDTPGNSFLAVEAGRSGTSADSGHFLAAIWVRHQHPPGVSHVYWVSTDPRARGRGLGRAAMLVGEHTAITAGDRFLSLNVFDQNPIATGLYRKLGYREILERRYLNLSAA